MNQMLSDPMVLLAFAAVAAFAVAITAIILRPSRDTSAAEHAQALADQLHQEQLAHGETRVRLEGAQQQIVEAKTRIEGLERRVEERNQTISAKDDRIARAEQDLANQKQAQNDWDKARQDFMNMAKASVTATANDVSSKLLKDHKHESEQAKKEAEARVGKITEELMKQANALSKQFVEVDTTSRENKESVATVLRALSAPGTSGHAAQTTLGNVLKNFSLVEGRDYHLEYTITGTGEAGAGRLRPDAVVFLPSDTVLVIDSKSSKHLLALAEAEEDEGASETAAQDFKRSMNQHLKDLSTKDYRSAVATALRSAGRDAEARQILTLMWLPNEGAVEKLSHADPNFTAKAAENQIYVTGPSGLWSAIGIASTRIQFETRQQNIEKIATLTGDLVQRVTTTLDHAAKIGEAISRAAKSFDDMAGSANSRVIPTMRKMGDLGLDLPAKGLPSPITRLDVRKDAIDTEAEEVTADAPLLFSTEAGEDTKKE
jgi:DNA recombination protein RmuC